MEALRGLLCQVAKLAGQATAALAAEEQPAPPRHPGCAALAALAWVHLERHELPAAGRLLTQLDDALGVSPDKLIRAVAGLAAACSGLAKGHGEAVAQMVARARAGWSVPAWLDRRLSLVEFGGQYVAAGDITAAVAAAERACGDSSPEAAATLAHAWLAAGDGKNARLVLASAPAARSGEPERVRVQAGLADARLSYYSGDFARGRRSLVHAYGADDQLIP